MPGKKLVDEQEVIRWINEGRTYRWMAEQYLAKYHVEIRDSAFSNFRRRRGLDNRVVRDAELVPWSMRPEHRRLYPVQMLRAEARRRAGVELGADVAARLESWREMLHRTGQVVAYDPESGFAYVPRTAEDGDLVRMPPSKNRRQVA